MLVNKHTKSRLSPNSKLFFQLGLALSMLIIYIAIEWEFRDKTIEQFGPTIFENEEILDIPITERHMEIKPPPPPPPAPETIEIVANEQKIIETIINSTETDEYEFVEANTLEIESIEEVIEEEVIEKDIPFAIIEEPPVYPGCKGTKVEKRKCLQNKITTHVGKHFNTDLAQDLGLIPGKQKVYVQFRIDKNGNITNIKSRGPHKRLEKEAIRVVQLLPQMTPGKQRTRSVAVSYTLPITLLVVNQ